MESKDIDILVYKLQRVSNSLYCIQRGLAHHGIANDVQQLLRDLQEEMRRIVLGLGPVAAAEDLKAEQAEVDRPNCILPLLRRSAN